MATAVLDLERAYDDAAACEPDGVAEEAEGDVEHHAGQPVSRGRDGEDESDGGGVGDDDGGTSGAEGDSDDDGEGGPQSVQRGRGRGRGRRGREGWGVGGSGRGRADAAPGGSDGDDDSDGAGDDDAEDSGGEGEGGGAREECATTAYSAAELQDLFERITDGAPENTKKAYRTQFNKFVDHCKAAKVDPAKLYSHALGAVAGKFFRKLTLSKAGRSTLANARSVLVLLDAANRLQLGQELGQEEAANVTPVADDVVFRKAFKAAMSLSVGQKVKRANGDPQKTTANHTCTGEDLTRMFMFLACNRAPDSPELRWTYLVAALVQLQAHLLHYGGARSEDGRQQQLHISDMGRPRELGRFVGPLVAHTLTFVNRDDKARKSGKHKLLTLMRAKTAISCPVRALGESMFARFTLSAEPFPDPTDVRDWEDRPLVPSPSDYRKHWDYEGQRRHFRALFLLLGALCSQVMRAFRVAGGARTLGDAGADAETVPRVGPRRAAADGSGTSDALTSPHQALLSLHGFDVMPPAAGGDHPSASLRTAHWAPRFAVSIPPPLLEKCKLSLFPFLPELRARVASIPAAVQAQRPSVPNVLAAVEWIGECCVQDTLELAQTAPSNPLVRRLYWKVPEWAGLLQSYIGAEREILATKPRDVLEVLDDVQAALDKLIAAGRAQGRASDLETRPQEQEQAGVVLAAAVQVSGPPQAARSPGVEGIYLGGSLSGGGGGLSVLQQQQQQMAQAWAAATDSGGVGGGGGGFPMPLGAASAAPIGVFWHHEHQQQQHQQQQQQAARSLGTGSGLGGGGGPSGGVGARSILQQLELCAKMLQQARAAAADSSGGGGGGGPSGGIGVLSLLQQLELCAATLQQAQLAQARAAAADGGGGGGGSFPSLPRTASAVPTDLAQMAPPSELIRELPNRTSTHDGFGSAASGFCGANGGGLGAQQQQQARAAAADSSGGGGGGAFPVSGGGLGALQAAPGAGAGAGPRRDSPTSFGGPGMPSGLGCDMSGGDLWHLQQQQHLQQQHHQQQLQTARSLGTDGGLGGGGGVGGGLLRPAGGQGAVWQHHSAAAAAGGGGLAAGLHHSAAAAGGGGGGLAAGSGPGRGSATWVGAAPVVGATAVAAAPSSSRALFPPGSWSALRGTAAVAAAAGGMLPGGAAPSTQPVQQQPVIFLTVTQSSMVSPPAAFPLLPASASSSERVPELRHLGSGLRPWPAGLRTVSELFRVMHLGQPGPRIPALMTLQGQYGDDWRRGFDPHIRKRWHELLFVYDQCVVQTQKVRGGTLNDAAEYWTAWMQYKKIGSVAGLYKYLKETLGKQDGPTLQQLVAVNREPGVVSPPKQAAPAAAVATSGGGGGGGGREVGGGPVGRRVTGYMLHGNHVRSEASKAGVSLEQQALAADPGMDMRKAANQAVKQIAALWGALSAEEKARWNAQAAGAAVGGDE
ncbi:hypothetical protein PLESTM_001942500 [Pleodorina starrii]|nr:hypothetical protein PLESTM_001942500 [Pleodorina starrii]